MNKRNIPELLSPAGGMEQLRAAVQNGADAVYMGGHLFNARIKAENFAEKDMKKAIDYAHERNVKIYVTLNTLIKDSELFAAFSYANFLYGAGADAVILQDMGLARLIKKYLPALPMHLSTQGTVYNKWAVDTAKSLGFCRIVPARELSLAEIEDFSAECHGGKIPCQVEVFVHGALCICYSGQCQMSKALGGNNARSGNRGMCAQPCRLPYEDHCGKKSFLLSPKDICTVEDIPKLCEAGIDSFKIEGRLKSPQYVAVVTGIYRKYLDMYRDEGHVKVQSGDMEELLQIFNRGGFGKGYLFGNPGQGLLSGASPKNQGIYVGKVKGVRKGSTLVDVECSGHLAMGDGVEIHSREVTGNVISYLKELPGEALRLGDIKGRVAVGDKVYKVTDKELMKKAERSYTDDSGKKKLGSGNFARKVPVGKVSVGMRFTGTVGKPAELEIWEIESRNTEHTNKWSSDVPKEDIENNVLSSIRIGAKNKPGFEIKLDSSIRIISDLPVEKAVKRATEPRRIEEQLSKLGDTPFEAADIDVCMDKEAVLPISTINKMRREAVKKLTDLKLKTGRKPLTEEELNRICESEKLGLEPIGLKKAREKGESAIYIYSREAFDKVMKNLSRGTLGSKEKPETIYVPLELFMESRWCSDSYGINDYSVNIRDEGNCAVGKDNVSGLAAGQCNPVHNVEIVPYILNVSLGNTDRYIEAHFGDIVSAVQKSGIMIGNLGWIDKFLEVGVPVYGDYGLNVYNRQSERVFEEMGVGIRAYSHEAEKFFDGNIPLMITEHPILSDILVDRKNKKYTILRWHSGDKYLIFRDRKGKTFEVSNPKASRIIYIC